MLWQSRPAEHDLPAGHAGHVPPPQSTSVSLPFFMPSVQLGAGMGWQTPPLQKFEPQSPLPVHLPPLPHFPHAHPPQSTSVSMPFFTPSEQVGAWHTPFVQTPLAQSLPLVHMLELAMAMAQFAVAIPEVAPLESITLTVKLAVPVAFGVPLITPLEEF